MSNSVFKSRLRKTLNILTDAENSTDTRGGEVHLRNKDFFSRGSIFFLRMSKKKFTFFLGEGGGDSKPRLLTTLNKKNTFFWKIVSSQANIRNAFFNQKSPPHMEVGFLRKVQN